MVQDESQNPSRTLVAALVLPTVAAIGLLAASPAGAVTYVLMKQEVMIPVRSHCSTYTGPGDLGTPSLKWSTLDEDNTATNVSNEDHLFVYPKESLLFDADEVENATCWYQLPFSYLNTSSVQITLVGHTPTFGNGTVVDFDIRYKARARDESLGHLANWSPWAATLPGEMEIVVPLFSTDLSSRTDPYALVPPGAADPGDVVQWRIRRNGTTDSFDSWFDVDYFILTYQAKVAWVTVP